MKPQTEKVLQLIARREGACMGSFIHSNVLRYSARIFELKQAGFLIAEEPCDRTDHKGHPSYSLAVSPPENLLELIDRDGYAPGQEPFGPEPGYQERMAGVRSL